MQYLVRTPNISWGGDKDSLLFSLGVTLSTFSDFLGKSVYITVKVLEDE